MEGSPVRGHQRVPVLHLIESPDVQSFQAEVIRLLVSEFRQDDTFFAVTDASSNMLQAPMWIRFQLERQPGLYTKLEQGELVGITVAEENPVPRPAGVARSSVVLIPVMAAAKLMAAIGLVSPVDGPQLAAEQIESARQLAYDVAPILSRLLEIEQLRQQNRELSAAAERLERIDQQMSGVIDEKRMLDAFLQMRSHLQVNVAHELRTPLAAIRGYTRMILDGRGGAVNDTQKDYLRIVTENTNRLITLVSWMSYVAEMSTHHLNLGAFDFRGIVMEAVGESRQKLAEKSLKLEQQIASEPFFIIGDREKLAYVLTELITVAMSLADAGGTITAELSHGREKEVIFKLSQKGASIPADLLSKIFDRPFNSLAKPVAQNTDSGAINLSGVYDIVGMHGGRVFVNSAAGQGVTFLFTLPAVTAGEEKSHEQAVNSSRRRR